MSTSARPENSKPERKRQDWLLVFLILLVGFCCVLGAGQYALRFAPRWQLDTSMESNIDLNSVFLTSKPQQFFEPLDPAILTQPSWVNGNVFLTPGAANPLVYNNTPLPTSNASTDVPTVIGTTAVATTTGIVTNTTVPTNTLVWIPIPATSTSKPGPAATNTSPPSVLTADLHIENTGSATWYAPGVAFNYTIVVSNTVPGSSSVTGVTVTDIFPLQVATATGSCSAIGTTCGWSGSGNINDVVNLPFGSTITYNINLTFNAGSSGTLVNSASISGAGYTETNSADNVASLNVDPGVDLVIDKNDGVGSYAAGGPLTYTITVTNNSTFAINNIVVTDVFSAQIANLSWSCGPASICTSSGTGNINDTLNMPAGPGSVATYTVNVTMQGAAVGPLTNTATVITPGGFTEINTANNSDFDTDSGPGGGPGGWINVGQGDGLYTTPGSGSPPVIMAIPPIVANGDGAYDLVYYERLVTAPPPDHIDLDWVQIHLSSDGVTWYPVPVFDWGNGSPDSNTNVNGLCPAETDNCSIPTSSLYGSPFRTGVAINIDSIVPAGSYSWISITCPSGDDGDGCDIDAIEVLP